MCGFTRNAEVFSTKVASIKRDLIRSMEWLGFQNLESL
jgi:hypothetical protein